jgi:hypothetical protein
MKNLPNLRTNSIVNKFILLGWFIILLLAVLNLNTILGINDRPEQEVIEIAETIQAKPVAQHVDSKQLNCLTKNIYYEAGSESELGKAAVARVTINRVKHGSFANTPCAVVYQSTTVPLATTEGETKMIKLCQFSWVCGDVRKPNPQDPRYKESERIAYQVLAYDAYKNIIPNTTLFFHSVFISPNWPYKQVKRIGNHIFYEKYDKRQKHRTVILAKAN